MPEVAEVAHACALLRRNVVGLTVQRAVLPLDDLLFPALKTKEVPDEVIAEAEKQLVGASVESVGRHGKYFWLRFKTAVGNPLVMLMHFGMTGRIRMRDVHSHMIYMENGGDKKVLEAKQSEILALVANEVKQEDTAIGDELTQASETEKSSTGDSVAEIWPPRFTKFELFLSSPKSLPERTVDMAFSDPRRLARVRFLEGKNISTDAELLQLPPLQSLGPDYSKKGSEQIANDRVNGSERKDEKNNEPRTKMSDGFSGDPDPSHHGRPRLSFEEFAALVLTKKKPIKAFLLDQEYFAGIGNWVSDEILYHARVHPAEVISKKIVSVTNPVLRRLYDAIIFVMEESVRVEGNAKLFPEDWLMLHRWGKGKNKPRAVTKTGHTVDFQTVGGRTSCFIPNLQKPLKKEQGISNLSGSSTTVKSEAIVSSDLTDTKPKLSRGSSAKEGSDVKVEETPPIKRRRTRSGK